MTRKWFSILLIVALLFSGTYSFAEQLEDQDSEFDQLLSKYEKIEAIEKVFNNGLPIYPDGSYKDEYAFDCLVDLPEITEETASEYIGSTYLLTGKCVEKKGFGCVFQLDDGRKLLVSFDIYDDGEYTDFFPVPGEKLRCNLYCTFRSWYHDPMYETDLNFTASVTQKAVDYCKKVGH